MLPRFFSNKPITQDYVKLEGAEQHHMVHVLRLQVGSRVTLFDDSGWEFEAELTEVGRNGAQLKVVGQSEVDRELPFSLTLGVALPKGDRQQWLVEKAVELGVTQLVPLAAERGVAQPRDKSLQRLQRWVVAASKQCGRNRLMRIAAPDSTSRFFGQAAHLPVLVAHPSAESMPLKHVSKLVSTQPESILLAVGPEGGFTSDEVNTARQSRCQLIDLGTRILRIETAAVFLVSINDAGQ